MTSAHWFLKHLILPCTLHPRASSLSASADPSPGVLPSFSHLGPCITTSSQSASVHPNPTSINNLPPPISFHVSTRHPLPAAAGPNPWSITFPRPYLSLFPRVILRLEPLIPGVLPFSSHLVFCRLVCQKWTTLPGANIGTRYDTKAR